MRTNRNGFSLLEIIIYIAVFAFVSVVAVETILLVTSSLGRIRVVRTLNTASSSAMERMTRTIRDAKIINAGSSTFNTSPGVLSLTGSETPAITYRFSVSGGGLVLDAGGVETALTPPGVAVTNLVFRSIANGTVSKAIKIELTIAASNGKATSSENVYNTVILRNSYAP